MKAKIAYQGEPGANSHIACIEAYPGFEPLSCRTFEDAFQAVKDGEAALAMIPIDNSVAGRVADIHHLMPAANLHIVGEYFLPRPSSAPGHAGRGRRRRQIRPQPCACAGPVPQAHPRTRLEGGCRGRYRRSRP